MNCTGKSRYLCAPNRDLTNLIEFCTDRPRSLFKQGKYQLFFMISPKSFWYVYPFFPSLVKAVSLPYKLLFLTLMYSWFWFNFARQMQCLKFSLWVHLSVRVKRIVLINICLLSFVVVSVIIHILLQNQKINLNQNWHKTSLGKGNFTIMWMKRSTLFQGEKIATLCQNPRKNCIQCWHKAF